MSINATSSSSGVSTHTASSSETQASGSTGDTSSSTSSEIHEGITDLILQFGEQILSQGRQAAADAKADDDDDS